MCVHFFVHQMNSVNFIFRIQFHSFLGENTISFCITYQYRPYQQLAAGHSKIMQKDCKYILGFASLLFWGEFHFTRR